MSDPDVVKKTRAFRIITCLMGLVKMLIFRYDAPAGTNPATLSHRVCCALSSHRQPHFRPDTALAQKLWDHWDDTLDRKYGLPKPSPRKNIKRLENLITMCVQNAVGEVFLYKQSVYKYDAGKVTEEYPKGKPFDIRMLWECVQLLQPTREMIHQAWSMGLEYSIGTSCMGLNTMTIIAEITGRSIGEWFNKPLTTNYTQYIKTDEELSELEHELGSVTEMRRKKKNGGGGDGGERDDDNEDKEEQQQRAEQRIIVRSMYSGKKKSTDQDFIGDEWERRFKDENSTFSRKDAEILRQQLRATREARAEYRYICSRSELQNQPMRDAKDIVDSSLGSSMRTMVLDVPSEDEDAAMQTEEEAHMMPRNEGESPGPRRMAATTGEGPDDNAHEFEDSDEEESEEAIGTKFWTESKVAVDDRDLLDHGEATVIAYHRARAIDLPGSHNCALEHPAEPHYQYQCPYCTTDLRGDALEEGKRSNGSQPQTAEDDKVEDEVYLTAAVSAVWPTVLEAAMFYKPQTILQLCAGKPAFIDPSGNVALGTRPLGASFRYKPKKNGGGGAARVDIAWIQAEGEQFKTWHKIACYVKERSGSRTCAEYDMHTDGLRDCMYLCSTRDNARRIPEEPRLPSDKTIEKNMQTKEGTAVTSTDVVVKTQEHWLQNHGIVAPAGHEHLPRNPSSNVPDSMLQRNLDSLYHGGRLCALNALTSNHVVSAPPIRLHNDGLEVNIGALHDHVSLIAESCLVCSEIAGLHNMQETFCNNQPGPDGLSAPPKKKDHAKSGDKRAADETPKNRDDMDNFTMPYSYDVASTAISWDMLSMLYDDTASERIEGANDRYSAAYGMKLEKDKLPHLSLRYIGYENANRQTLSMRIPMSAERDADHQHYVEAGDPDAQKADISIDHVQRSMSRKVTEQDVIKYISRRQGARSMKGVTGDLFASSTWLLHTLATLEDRGLIKGLQTEAAVKALSDMEHCIHARIAEYGSAKNMGQFKGMDLMKSEPNTYEAKVERRKVDAAKGPQVGHSKNKMRIDVLKPGFNVRSIAFAADEDDGLGCTPMDDEDDPMAAGAGLEVGRGPEPC